MGKIKGQKEWQRFKEDKSLTRKQAILAQCYSCNGEEEGAEDCLGSENCPLYAFFSYKGKRRQNISLKAPTLKLVGENVIFKGNRTKGIVIAILLFLSFSPCWAETGIASYYGNGEKLNKYTANGEVFDPTQMTCATYNYPFNTWLKVTNLTNGKEIIVRVNDRGPNKRLGRVIDLI